MKRRILVTLCVLALLVGALSVAAYAAGTDAADGAAKLIRLEQDIDSLTVSEDVYLDLNGHNIGSVTVQSGTLYCMDSQTDDYDIEDDNYGKIRAVSGNVVKSDLAADGYLMVEEADGISLHRVDMQISEVTLRPDAVGMYYTSSFFGDELVAENVESFGVALSVIEEPDENNMETHCGYSVFKGFRSGESNTVTGTLLRDIMKGGNGDDINARNAAMDVYGKAYIKTAEGYMFGASQKRSLEKQIKDINKMWDDLLNSQKTALIAMYGKYETTMKEWKIPAISNGEVIKDKFAAKEIASVEIVAGTEMTLGDLFIANAKIDNANVSVTVIAPEGSYTFTQDKTDWAKSTIVFHEKNVTYTVTITDHDSCNEAANTVTTAAEYFVTKFPNTDKYLYRVGNQNAVALGSLFAGNADAAISGDVTVVVKSLVDNSTVIEAEIAKETWTSEKLQFVADFTGPVEVTIDALGALPYTLNLEVVDAVNATSAASATTQNVVLLNDCGFSTIEVSGGYTLYGNGFTITCGSDQATSAMSYGFVQLENGTLDNVQVICPSFSHHVLYDSNMKDSENVDPTAEWRYFNTRSAVVMKGNSRIENSYISGGRAAVYVTSGNAVIENSTIHGGTTANIHVGAAQQLLLKDVSLIQEPLAATVNDPGKVMMGFSVLVTCDENGDATPIMLEGKLRQYAWANEDYLGNVNLPTGTDSIISTVLRQDAFKHDIPDIDPDKPVLNLGIAYMPAEMFKSVGNVVLQDDRTDKEAIPYSYATFSVLGTTAKIYSYNNSNGIHESMATKADYIPNQQMPVLPTVTFADSDGSRVFETTYDGHKGWTSTVTVDLDALGSYIFDFAKLVAQKYGQSLDYTVTDESGKTVDKSQPIDLNGPGGYDFVLEITDDLYYDANGERIQGEAVIRTYHFTLIAQMTSIDPPVKVAEVGGTPLLVAKGYDSDWSCALPALEGTQIKYWSVADREYKTLTLSELTPTKTGKQNGTNNYWSYTAPNNDYTLTVTCGVIHEGKSVYGMPVVVNNDGNKLYFTISNTNGYVSTGTTARTVTISYEFKDNNGGTLAFSETWNFVRQDQIGAGAKQYSYSDFVNGKLTELASGGGCITPDTLVTLADGSQVRVDALTGTEQLLVWNMETGAYDAAPIVFVDSDAQSEYQVVHLHFSDGTDVKVIYEHGFFDMELGKYVYLDATNAADYIGHSFVKRGNIAEGAWETVQLTDVVIENKVTTAYSPVTFSHLCYYVDGMLSMPGGIKGLFNIFEVDTDTLAYDAGKKAQDIETYGLFTYEDFAGVIPEEAFYAFNGAYLKVAIEKGMLTWEDIEYLAQRYVPMM